MRTALAIRERANLAPMTVWPPTAATVVRRDWSGIDGDAALLKSWLHGRSANTERAYRKEAERFLAFAGAPVREVTVQTVQDYADLLADSGLAASSQGRALATVKSLLAYGFRLGYLQVNAGAPVKLTAPENTLAQRIVDEETVRRVIEGEPDDRNRTMLRLLYFGGLRRSELAGLRWHDMKERSDGRGQATVYGKGARTRAVLLPSPLWQELLAMRHGAGEDEPVFRSRNHQPISPSRVWQVVKRAGERAGVPALAPHWFRHACASHSLEHGADVAVVRDTLGHSSIATTSMYLHARPNDGAGLYLADI